MDVPVKVTVIVPVYNVMQYLTRCVDSIRAQSYRNLEILLVDDGSTDNSGALCEKFALEDKRIRVFHKENGGSSSARNLGIEMATGDYIAFVDSDDYIEPEMMEHLLQAALSGNLRMAQCSRDEIDEKGNRMPDVCLPPEKQVDVDGEDVLRELLMHRGDCSFCTKLTETSLLKEHRFPEGELNEDFRLLVELLPQLPVITILPQQDYHVFYRYGSNTRTRNQNEFPRVFTDIVNNADFVMEIVKEQYPALLPQAERFSLVQRLDYLLHIPIPMMKKDNAFYVRVCQYVKQHRHEILHNPYLTKKNRQYLLLFSFAPAFARKVHALLMRVRKTEAKGQKSKGCR